MYTNLFKASQLIIQIINLSDREVFNAYSDNYKIFRDVFQIGLFGLEIRSIELKFADTIKKIVLKEGEICYKTKREDKLVNLLIPGSMRMFKELSHRILSIGDEDLGYKIINVIKKYEEYDLLNYKICNRDFNFNKAYIMGILNVTENSFSDGGKYLNPEAALKHAFNMIEEGADIIDIGAVSTKPGSDPVDEKVEIKRIIPVIEKILKKYPDTIISVDTQKSNVAEAALESGAKIINDVSGFNFDPSILKIVKKYNAAYVLMHMKGIPKSMQQNPFYEDLVTEIYDFLFNKIAIIKKTGINNIFIDPGIGFGKSVDHNYELLRRLGDFKSLGCPILAGVSRKSFIGKSLALEIDQRDFPSSIIETLAIKNGAKIIRTHNVKNGVQVINILNHFI